jgi:hypothetical protein
MRFGKAIDASSDDCSSPPSMKALLRRGVATESARDPYAAALQRVNSVLEQLLGMPPPPAQVHERHVHDDPVKPGRESRFPGEARDASKGRREGFLDDVASILLVAYKPPRDREEGAGLSLDHVAERSGAAAAEPADELRLVETGLGW